MSLILATAFLGTMTYGVAMPVSLNVHDTYTQGAAEDSLQIPVDPAPPLPVADRRFITAAAQDNLVAMAALHALAERSSDETLRRFASRSLDDRKALQEALEVLAIRKDITLPRQPPALAQTALNRLAALSGDAFDRDWIHRYGNLPQRTAARFGPAQQRQLQNEDVQAFAAEQSAILRAQAEAADQAVSACACAELSNPAAGAATAHSH